MAEGGRCELQNPDYRTGLVWEGFVTAGPTLPSPIEFDPATYEVFQVGAAAVEPFFVASKTRTIAFDIPQMSLVGARDGLFVTSWGAHASGYPRASRPHGLLSEIDRKFGPHPAYGDDQVEWSDVGAVKDLTRRLTDGIKRRSEICRWLMDRAPDWELFLTAFSEPHSAGEAFWHGVDDAHLLSDIPQAKAAREALYEVYEALDSALGDLRAALPADTVLVLFSLHGMKQNTGDVPSGVLLPELLYRLRFHRNFVRDATRDGWAERGFPPVIPSPGEWPPTVVRRLSSETPKGLIRRAADTLLPRQLQQRLVNAYVRKKGVGDTFSHGVGSVPPEADIDPDTFGSPKAPLRHVAAWQRPVWPHMRAFALPTFGDGRIRMNMRNREARGSVGPAGYWLSRAATVDLLTQMRDPRTGQPALKDYVLLEGDPYARNERAADIEILWSDNLDSIQHPSVGIIGPFRLGRTGGHTENGFALIQGAGLRGELGSFDARDLPAAIMGLGRFRSSLLDSRSDLAQALSPAR
jgi:predicted AlkP superfamily phosphohydrolase/phosphomutase